MSRSRRIVLHIGAPKTGTSAIQRFLVSNVDALRSIGFDYLKGEPDCGNLPTTGNGLPIFLYFEHAEAAPEKLKELIDSYFGAQRAALVSSEVLSFIPLQGWQSIIDACRAADADPSIVFYVRNVHPFYVSSYNQVVKHHGAVISFEEFVEKNHVFACKELLDFLARTFGPDHLNVAHYESHKGNICAHFLSIISPTADPSEFKFHFARVNRSLDESELRLMRIANRFPRAHFPRELSNLLISSDPDRRSDKPVRPEVIELLTHRHIDEVSEINEKYFSGDQVLRIVDDVQARGNDAAATASPAERLFEWAMARLDSGRHENFQQFLDEARGRAIRSRKVIHPDIPPDFDAAAYLLANPDLLMARVDPYRHFLDYGRKEGRSWRIDGSMASARRRTPGDVLDQAIWSVARVFKSFKARRGS